MTIPHLPALLVGRKWGEKKKKGRGKISPGRREERGEDGLNIWVSFSLSYSDLIGKTLIIIQAGFGLPVTVTGEQSLSVHISIHKPLVIFSLHSPSEKGEQWSSFGGYSASSQSQSITVTRTRLYMKIIVGTSHKANTFLFPTKYW